MPVSRIKEITMGASVPIHSEPDAVVTLIGDLRMENGVLVVGDTDVAKKFAATAGMLHGGRG